MTKTEISSENLSLLNGDVIHYQRWLINLRKKNHFGSNIQKEDAQDSGLPPFFRYLSQSGKPSEVKPPLKAEKKKTFHSRQDCVESNKRR